MQKQTTRDTACEVAIRQELHSRGLRYRVHRRPVPGIRRTADIVFGSAKVAVFVNGCFWHGCLEHATWPKSNAEFWRAKIEGNRARDAATEKLLRDAGWECVTIWEHEDPGAAADRIGEVVRKRRPMS